ncbi:transglycosylase SLT domain-containing protein [Ancylobacter sp.]|uniref:transglycosylase SLT domain-containing protein n=1 Tax=Ancylobacter sp. TaxID=1872567 RepID=UPI003D0DF00C
MNRRLRAGALPALVGAVVFGALPGASPAWAASAPQPVAPASTRSSNGSATTPAQPVARPADKTIRAVLLTPLPHARADLVAPSYASWVTVPHDAPPGGWLVVKGEVATRIETSHRVTTIALPARRSAAASAAAAAPSDVPSPVPLPPKRLAEIRSTVMPAVAPLPPPRLSETAPATALAMAAPEPQPDLVAAVPDIVADIEADTPQEDAAAPIDNSPEPASSRPTAERAPAHIEALIQRHAERFDVPATLVRRVAWRESKFDPRQRHGPYWGLMQIRVDTARGLGFRGSPTDLLDADTNMTYAVAYLANAYRVAGRDEKRAVTLYAKGYYYEAKRKRMLDSLIRTAAAER